MALEPAKLSDFAVAGSLGTGTTAKVYDAIHRASGRAVAIKLMDQASSDGDVRERFAREALLLAGVESRFVGKILGFGFERGQPFLVLERLYGETLDAKLRRDGPIAPQVAFRWIEQLLVGVRDCHDANVIHRDIKPSNIFVHFDGFVEGAKLIDFGVARLRELGTDIGDLTGSNQMIGSMAYMAPEQFDDPKSVGFQADLYAVGVVVYRTLTGRLPFVSRSVEAVIRMKAEQTPPAISAMGGALQIPLLDTFVRSAMRRDSAQRFRSAREMLEQWRVVMGSLDEDATDIMGGVGRVDESYAGPRPRSREQPDEEDRTLREFQIPLPSGRGSVVPPPSVFPPRSATVQSSSPRRVSSDSFADRTIREPAPVIPMSPLPVTPAAHGDEGGEGGGGGGGGVDGEVTVGEADARAALQAEDLPTRTDATLRELVQRELELFRSREPKR